MQENQFYSYRSRINRGGALKQEDERGLRGGRAVPGMDRVPRSRSLPGAAAALPQSGFCSDRGVFTQSSSAARAQPHGVVLRKIQNRSPKRQPEHPAPGSPRTVPARAVAPSVPAARLPGCVSFVWLKSLGFAHDCVVFLGSGKW